MGSEERSQINLCVQPAKFNWKTRLLTSLLYSVIQRVVSLRPPRKVEGREEEKGEEANPFFFVPSSTEMVYRDTGAWCQILFPGDMLCL